jgi:hypothetical protein
MRTTLCHAPRRPTIGNGFASIAGGHPIAPCRTQEVDEVRVVYAQYEFEAEPLRGNDVPECGCLDPVEDVLRTLSALVRDNQLAPVQLRTRVSQQVLFGINSNHGLPLR